MEIRRKSGNLFSRSRLGLFEREAFCFFASCEAFLDVVFSFAVSHKVGNKHALALETKLIMEFFEIKKIAAG